MATEGTENSGSIQEIAHQVAQMISQRGQTPQPFDTSTGGTFTLGVTIGATEYGLTISIPASGSGGEYTFALTDGSPVSPPAVPENPIVTFNYTPGTSWNVQVGLPQPIQLGSNATIEVFTFSASGT